MANLAADW